MPIFSVIVNYNTSSPTAEGRERRTMRTLAGRYLNEIIALTIMALMTIALIAAQADATVHESTRSDAGYEDPRLEASLETITESTIIRADLEIQLDLDQLIDVATASDSGNAVRELIHIKLKGDD